MTAALQAPKRAKILNKGRQGAVGEGAALSRPTLRPTRFEEFDGQQRVKDKLKIFVTACQRRGESLDHCLFSGPPGLGKTTLAHIIASSLKVPLKAVSAPALRRKGDMVSLLTTLQKGTVLFIDEVHRLSRDIEEYLYSAMEDFYIDIVTGEGFGARSIRFQLPAFTLVGATTRIGLLKSPFRDRFGIIERLSFYEAGDLEKIVLRSARMLKIPITGEGAKEIAGRSRGTPRIANRLLRRIRDFAQVQEGGGVKQEVSGSLACEALNRLGIDGQGLDFMDLKILHLIHRDFQGGPVGIDTLSAALGEETDTLQDFYEPFLIQQGLIKKTARGRMLTHRALNHIQKKGQGK